MTASLVVEDAEGAFYSLLAVTDMLAEYTGIAASCFIIPFWRDKPLAKPYQYYAKSTLVGSTPDLTPQFFSCALQFACELFVDGCCVYFERRLDHWRSWGLITRTLCKFILLYCFVALVGGTVAEGVILLSDQLVSCDGQDMCLCVNHGLVVGGVRESYCRLIYPNATWDATPQPLLGPHISTFGPDG